MSSIASPARREESWSGQRRSPPTTLVLFPQRTTRSQTSRVSELRNPGDTIPNDASNSKCSIPWFGGTYASFRYSVKLGRTLSMEQYQLDEPLRPGLDIILPSPKRRSRSRTLNPSIYSSPNAIDSDREMSLDYSYKDAEQTQTCPTTTPNSTVFSQVQVDFWIFEPNMIVRRCCLGT
ncbi:hypothetical protein RSOL_075730 [Rhizoctonia solani AG-3 Rhs1AP]|uniref:Uncharacterized protein n=1 Tax=Rhizoctonia solani AG-3 Rhs1AP TaxID=1086054 RepID=X8IYV3_9AGAM|nr:hypothetical protein RSOL_075730 [Rhizoctonia solani AG-3 Rhs1AP]